VATDHEDWLLQQGKKRDLEKQREQPGTKRKRPKKRLLLETQSNLAAA